MLNSIRWSLQLWHASLLAAVLVGFGAVSYYGVRHMRYAQVDADLQSRVQLLAARTRFWPGPPPDHNGPGNFGGNPGDFHPGDGFHFKFPDRSPDAGKPPEGNSPPDPPNRSDTPANPYPLSPIPFLRPDFSRNKFDIPPDITKQYDTPNSFYFVVWNAAGEILSTSTLPDGVTPGDPPAAAAPGPPRSEPPHFRQRGNLREATLAGPFGTRFLVGRSIAAEQSDLRNLALLLAATGTAVLALGLAGGWLLSYRVVKPIQKITAAAQKISASNLSERINIAGTQTELETLASVLNSAFARLDHSFQQQIRFTADASHELRTPLSVIHTNSQLALSQERSPADYRKTIETCLRASTRMKGLVDSLLLLARVDSHQLDLQKQHLDLQDIVAESAAMLAPLAAEKNITLTTHLQPAPLHADPARIAQVVTNLLTNAIRYNRPAGTVTVTLTTDATHALLQIADTGVGIPPENQPHLFERFYRVDPARSRAEGGSGLGLAICQSIIQAESGSITFISQPDIGSAFTVQLPLSAMSVPAHARAGPQRPDDAS